MRRSSPGCIWIPVLVITLIILWAVMIQRVTNDLRGVSADETGEISFIPPTLTPFQPVPNTPTVTNTLEPTETPQPTIDYRATEQMLLETQYTVQTEQTQATNIAQEAIYRLTADSVEAQIQKNTIERESERALAEAETRFQLTQIQAQADILSAQSTTEAEINNARKDAEIATINNERENQIKFNDAVSLATRFLLLLSTGIALVLILIAFNWSGKIIKAKGVKGRRDARDEVNFSNAYNQAVELDEGMKDLASLLEYSVKWHNAEGRSPGEEQTKIIPSDKMASWSGEKWTRAVGILEGRYLVVKIQGGSPEKQGTFLKIGNLGKWYQCVVRGQFFNPDPLKGIV